jgi:ribosomal protein S18 acetylase RimI-like enzyme
MELEIVKNEKKYFEYIRQLRNDELNQIGFLEKVNITADQQNSYMSKYKDNYYICLSAETPVGYIGVVSNDIRVCTDVKFKNLGIGSFMLKEIMKIYPYATAKILKNNYASLKLFEKCNFKIVNSDKNLYYLEYGV